MAYFPKLAGWRFSFRSIVLISPKEQGPAGAGAPGPAPDKAHSRSTWAGRAGGRRPRPARRPQLPGQRGTAHPRRLPANPARRWPGRTSPGDTSPSATPRLGPGTKRAPAPPGAGQSAGRACAARRLARARGPTREAPPPPPHAAGARAPPPRSQARVNRRPPRPRPLLPHPQRRRSGLVGAGWAPNTAGRRSPDPPLSVQRPPRREGASLKNKSPARDGNRGRGWGRVGMRRRGLTRRSRPQRRGRGRRREECGPRARELWPRRSSLGLRRAGERAGGERARGPSVPPSPVTAAWPPPLAGPRSAPRSSSQGNPRDRPG